MQRAHQVPPGGLVLRQETRFPDAPEPVEDGATFEANAMKKARELADALGVSLVNADAANVWIHLHPGADPHSLIDDGAAPPQPTKMPEFDFVNLNGGTLKSSEMKGWEK